MIDLTIQKTLRSAKRLKLVEVLVKCKLFSLTKKFAKKNVRYI